MPSFPFLRAGFAAGALLLALSTPVQGAVLFETGLPVSGGLGVGGSEIAADNFTLAQDATVNSVTYYPVDFASFSVTGISWRIYRDDSNLPGDLVSAGQVTGSDLTLGAETSLGDLTYRPVTLNLGGIYLQAGPYWFALFEQQSDATVNLWGTLPQAVAPSAVSAADASATPPAFAANPGVDLAFLVEGVVGVREVPEPGAIALVGTGLVLLGLARRRR